MKKLSFYEQVGILIPGAVFLFGTIFYVPDLKNAFAAGGISVGGLGVFVLLGYATGHALAALGNLLEGIYWRFRGGMPSGWVAGPNPRLLSPAQIAKLSDQVHSRLGLTVGPLASMTAETWLPISRQIYSDVERYGKPGRIETFNGNYGLNRGLSAALVGLAIVNLCLSSAQWYVSIALIVLAGVYMYRMHRFGRNRSVKAPCAGVSRGALF